jgi:beta-glucosidase
MIKAVKEGKISEERLNDAVRRILLVKSRVGLYSEPLPNQEQYTKFASQEFKNKSKETAIESITLLKNDNNALPLSPNQKVLVAGPTANNLIFLNGAWTHTWQGVDTAYNTKNCLNVREAFETEIGKSNCFYAPGAELYLEKDFENTRFKNLDDYKQKVKMCDVVVLCLGELPSTEKPGDIRSLNLSKEQMELARIASAEKKKVILVLLEARPRIIHDIVDDANAIIQAYLPGDFGAEALVDLIYGKRNFSGKLPYTYPKYDGVIEFYDHPASVDRSKSGQFNAYDPEWDFGFGLNYSNVKYDNLILAKNQLIGKDSLEITVELSNNSQIPCKEVVQLYISDDYASVIPTGKSLKGFQKIEISSNGKASCKFYVTRTDLKFVGKEGNFIVEEGFFTIRVGNLESKFEFKNK